MENWLQSSFQTTIRPPPRFALARFCHCVIAGQRGTTAFSVVIARKEPCRARRAASETVASYLNLVSKLAEKGRRASRLVRPVVVSRVRVKSACGEETDQSGGSVTRKTVAAL